MVSYKYIQIILSKSLGFKTMLFSVTRLSFLHAEEKKIILPVMFDTWYSPYSEVSYMMHSFTVLMGAATVQLNTGSLWKENKLLLLSASLLFWNALKSDPTSHTKPTTPHTQNVQF